MFDIFPEKLNRLTKKVLMKKLLSIAVVLCMVFLFSCKKEESNGGPHKVVYKAIGSPGTQISVAVVATDGIGGAETFTSLTGDTWTSKEYVFENSMGMAAAAVNGTGPSATSTLKVEIWIDGEKKAEGNSTGEILSASGSYSFNLK